MNEHYECGCDEEECPYYNAENKWQKPDCSECDFGVLIDDGEKV